MVIELYVILKISENEKLYYLDAQKVQSRNLASIIRNTYFFLLEQNVLMV